MRSGENSFLREHLGPKIWTYVPNFRSIYFWRSRDESVIEWSSLRLIQSQCSFNVKVSYSSINSLKVVVTCTAKQSVCYSTKDDCVVLMWPYAWESWWSSGIRQEFQLELEIVQVRILAGSPLTLLDGQSNVQRRSAYLLSLIRWTQWLVTCQHLFLYFRQRALLC